MRLLVLPNSIQRPIQGTLVLSLIPQQPSLHSQRVLVELGMSHSGHALHWPSGHNISFELEHAQIGVPSGPLTGHCPVGQGQMGSVTHVTLSTHFHSGAQEPLHRLLHFSLSFSGS